MSQKGMTAEQGPSDAEPNPKLEHFRTRLAGIATAAASLFGPEPIIRALVGCALGLAVNLLGLQPAKSFVARMLSELLGDDAQHWPKAGRA